MARSQSQKLSSSARSEIGGEKETYAQKFARQEKEEDAKFDNYKKPTNEEYEKNWEKLTKPKLGDFKFGDGVVGNGIIRDGQLHLRFEDIVQIAGMQFGSGFRDELERNGFNTIKFNPFYGDNNFIDKKAQNEIETHAIFAEGERQMDIDYEAERVNELDRFVDRDFLKIDYEKAMGNGIKISEDSVERLARGIERAIAVEQTFMTQKREENTDFESINRSDRADFLRRERRDNRDGYFN